MNILHGIKDIINGKTTLKIVVSTGNGVPHAAPKNSLRLNDDGNMEYVEIFESSTSLRNVTESIWFNRKVSVLIIGQNKEAFSVTGRIDRIRIAGREFETAYKNVLDTTGYDISAVVVIIPETLEDLDPKKKQEREKREHPFFTHLDTLTVPSPQTGVEQ